MASSSAHVSLNTSSDLESLISSSKNIIVIAGAGISTSCGIPDFRSTVNGLYNNLDCEEIGIPSAELLFDLEYFKVDPKPFYKFSHTLLLDDSIRPSISHQFIKELEKRKKLLRVYTQNVDGLERVAGIKKSITCHGSMDKLKCLSCKKVIDLYPSSRQVSTRKSSSPAPSSSSSAAAASSSSSSFHHPPNSKTTNDATSVSMDNGGEKMDKDSPPLHEFYLDNIKSGHVCYCQNIVGPKTKKVCEGIMKPEITFFGEHISKKFFSSVDNDVLKCDLIIVMGTSLKVGGSIWELIKLANNTEYVNRNIPQVLFNRDLVTLPKHVSKSFDANVLGTCDDICAYFARKLDWTLNKSLPADFTDEKEDYVIPSQKVDNDSNLKREQPNEGEVKNGGDDDINISPSVKRKGTYSRSGRELKPSKFVKKVSTTNSYLEFTSSLKEMAKVVKDPNGLIFTQIDEKIFNVT
jgi:NAD-dependent SIR2 family protein deacetylase